MLANFLVVTKGYGLTVRDIENSSPREMKPYEDAYLRSQQLLDRNAWSMGNYVTRAVMVAIDHAFNGKKAKSEYFKKPCLEQYFEDMTLTQEEIDNRELQKMIAYERQQMAKDRANGLKPPTLMGD
jgi:hypothetical protein